VRPRIARLLFRGFSFLAPHPEACRGPSEFKWSRIISERLKLIALVGLAPLWPALACGQVNGMNNSLQNSRVLVACDLGDVDPFSRITPKMDWVGLAERDLVLVVQRTDDVVGISQDGEFDLSFNAPLINDKSCNSADFILIGKDGRAKKSWVETVPVAELFNTIDAVPMRKFEMRVQRRAKEQDK